MPDGIVMRRRRRNHHRKRKGVGDKAYKWGWIWVKAQKSRIFVIKNSLPLWWAFSWLCSRKKKLNRNESLVVCSRRLFPLPLFSYIMRYQKEEWEEQKKEDISKKGYFMLLYFEYLMTFSVIYIEREYRRMDVRLVLFAVNQESFHTNETVKKFRGR